MRDFQKCRDGSGFDYDISALSWYNFADEKIGVYPCNGAAYYFVKVAHRVLPPESNTKTSYDLKEIVSRPLDPDKPAVVFATTGEDRPGHPKKRHRFSYGCTGIVWSNEAFKALPFKDKLPLIEYGVKEVDTFINNPD